MFSVMIQFAVDGMKGFDMTDNEVQKYNVIKKVVNKEMTQKEAMIELNKSRHPSFAVSSVSNRYFALV